MWPQLGSSKPQRLASCDETEAAAPAPQLAHLRSTSSAGGVPVDHRAPLTMKNEDPQFWQANPFCSISRRRRVAGRSPAQSRRA
jgi:hypothetical protein